MKLILESWRTYSAQIDENQNTGVIYLFENKKPVKTEFNILLESFDNGKLTADQLIETWEKSFDYELKLLTEVNWEKEAGMLDNPDYKPPAERGGILAKIKNLIDAKSVQFWQLMQKGKEVGLKAAISFARMAAGFREKHPTISRAVTVVAMASIIFVMIAALDSPEAHAKLARGDKVFDDTYINMVKAAATDIARETAEGKGLGDRMKAMQWAQKAVEMIDNVAKSAPVDQISQLEGPGSALVRGADGYIQDLLNIMRDTSLPAEERKAAIKALDILKKTTTELIKNT